MGFTVEELNPLWDSVGIERKEIPEEGDVPIFSDSILSRGAAYFICNYGMFLRGSSKDETLGGNRPAGCVD
jgi:hypothetical protein